MLVVLFWCRFDPQAVSNGKVCHVHSLGLNQCSKWLSHLKQQTPAPSYFNFFLAITICKLMGNCLSSVGKMFDENYLISFHYMSFKLIKFKK